MPVVKVDHESYHDVTQMGEVYGVHKVEITNATSCHLPASGSLIAAGLLPETRGGSILTFYIGGAGNKSHVAIDGGTVGDSYTVVTKHRGSVNVGDDR